MSDDNEQQREGSGATGCYAKAADKLEAWADERWAAAASAAKNTRYELACTHSIKAQALYEAASKLRASA